MNNIKSNIQVEPEHYEWKKYNSKSRWISFWHQIDEIMKLEPESVLEIGIGSGVVSKFLKANNVNITMMDIDERLNPDKVGSVLDIPFSAKTFEVIACYEVLEHIPYENVKIALEELKRVSKKYVLVSVPDVSRVYRYSLQIPKLGEIQNLIAIPRFKKLEHQFDGEHYWEIGKKNYSLERIITDLEKTGLNLVKTFRVFEKPYHRFFLLDK